MRWTPVFLETWEWGMTNRGCVAWTPLIFMGRRSNRRNHGLRPWCGPFNWHATGPRRMIAIKHFHPSIPSDTEVLLVKLYSTIFNLTLPKLDFRSLVDFTHAFGVPSGSIHVPRQRLPIRWYYFNRTSLWSSTHTFYHHHHHVQVCTVQRYLYYLVNKNCNNVNPSKLNKKIYHFLVFVLYCYDLVYIFT